MRMSVVLLFRCDVSDGGNASIEVGLRLKTNYLSQNYIDLPRGPLLFAVRNPQTGQASSEFVSTLANQHLDTAHLCWDVSVGAKLCFGRRRIVHQLTFPLVFTADSNLGLFANSFYCCMRARKTHKVIGGSRGLLLSPVL